MSPRRIASVELSLRRVGGAELSHFGSTRAPMLGKAAAVGVDIGVDCRDVSRLAGRGPATNIIVLLSH